MPAELRRRGYPGWNRTSVLLIQRHGGMPATLLVSSAEGASRTHRPRGLSSRGLPIAVTPAWCAARDLNPAPQIKSLLHHHSCSQRVVGTMTGLEPASSCPQAGAPAKLSYIPLDRPRPRKWRPSSPACQRRIPSQQQTRWHGHGLLRPVRPKDSGHSQARRCRCVRMRACD